MSLTPYFSVCPHGVKRFDDTKRFYAVFKLLVHVSEFDNATQNSPLITETEWKTFLSAIDRQKLYYQFQANVLTVGTGTSKGSAITFPDPDSVNDPLPDRAAIPGIFQAGLRQPYQKTLVFAPMNKAFADGKRFTRSNPPEKKAIGQHWRNVTKHDKDRQKIRHDAMRKSFDQAEAYRKRHLEDDGLYDFRLIYGTIMNDPFIAEKHFGLIREFLIPLDIFINKTTGTSAIYTINIPDNPKQDTANYCIKQKNGKAYNGLLKSFYLNDDFLKNADGTSEVGFSDHDLYKSTLAEDGKTPHPDGIYLNAVYKNGPNPAEIVDPFNQPGLKGYNAVVQTLNLSGKNSFFSLSWHHRKYTFYDKLNALEKFTSATLAPRTEVKTGDSGGTRNNILFAWRGDNLLVNRMGHQQEPQGNTGAHVGTQVTFDRDNKENHFIHQDLYVLQEDLAADTQIQLRCGQSYRFVLRTVGFTEYCMPLIKEISPEQLSYTWTVEDELRLDPDLQKSTIGPGAYIFDLSSIQKLPIKSPNIVGPKPLGADNSGFSDSPTHLVIDRIAGTEQENRYIYPPQIKLEDFRFLGYFDQKKLMVNNEDEFKTRCIRLEHRSKRNYRSSASAVEEIAYLADPRSTGLIFFPANLYTLHKIPQIAFPDIFRYGKTHPYFEQTSSAELSVQKMATAADSYRMTINGKDIAGVKNQGVYSFRLYSTDGVSPFAPEKYNYQQLDIAIIDRPDQLVVANKISEPLRSLPDSRYANYWYAAFNCNESDTWRSVKYTEQTQVLVLDRPDTELRKASDDYTRNHPLNLMIREYPYEALLVPKGELDQPAELQSNIYPDNLMVDLLTDAATFDGKVWMSLRLNDKDNLEARGDQKLPTQLTLFLNGIEIFRSDLLAAKTPGIKLKITLDAMQNRYQLSLPGVKTPPISLSGLIHPELDIRDITVNDDVLAALQQPGQKKYKIDLLRNNKYVFVNNLQHPYSAIKKVRLFCSSPYQGYFPQFKKEADIGTPGTETYDLHIRNNCKPATPSMDASILMMHTRIDNWNNNGLIDERSNKMQMLVQLTLSQVFMLEGQNTLALILGTTGQDKSMVCTAGEDITKLTDHDEQAFTDLLITDKQTNAALKKYLGKQETLTIDHIDYTVRHLIPYYNSDLKRWQAIIEFNQFNQVETMFFKFVVLKVSPGKLTDPKAADQSIDAATNYSLFSEAVILPVYDSRTIRLQRYKTDNYFKVLYDSLPNYKRKLFYLMMLNEDYNMVRIDDQTNIFPELMTFTCIDADNASGKVLLYSGDPVSVLLNNCKKVLVLEFEALNNCTVPLNPQPQFVSYNPIFGQEGMRLINMSEFITT